MAVDEELVKKLEAAVKAVGKVLEDCEAARKEILNRYKGGIGAYRGWAPVCTGTEQTLGDLRRRLEEARQGQSPSGDYADPLPPPYFSNDSKDLYDRIQRRMDDAGQLRNWIVFGTAIAAGETFGVTIAATGGDDLKAAINALGAIGPILRDAVHTDVGLFLVDRHSPNLTGPERKYWEPVYAATSP